MALLPVRDNDLPIFRKASTKGAWRRVGAVSTEAQEPRDADVPPFDMDGPGAELRRLLPDRPLLAHPVLYVGEPRRVAPVATQASARTLTRRWGGDFRCSELRHSPSRRNILFSTHKQRCPDRL